ncbi:hypothetical protein GF322_05220 [Candidatus Dependentiae bacterium]|nr:hypothetical protein [Candidatus Dependentiae bacterium]
MQISFLIKRSFILLVFTFFQISVFPISNQEILQKIESKFPSNTPGLNQTLDALNKNLNDLNDGRWFELEVALYAEEYMNEKVLGFGLSIEFWDENKEQRLIYLNADNNLDLKNTEYDIVTQNFMFECKLCRNPKNFDKIKQFNKERRIILFFKMIHEHLIKNQLSINCKFKKTKKREFCIFTINGILTNYKDISFSLSWINSKTVEECLKQFDEIVKLIASKSLIVMFKGIITQNLMSKLSYWGFEYMHGIKAEDSEQCGFFIWNFTIQRFYYLLSKLNFCNYTCSRS